jgi:pimeloyl-ACP methyl ester carboxylesterase
MPTHYGRLSVTLAKRAPGLARSLTRSMRRAGLRDPSVISRRFQQLLTAPADREILRTAGTDVARVFLEATRQGPYETVEEQRTMLQPPGFRLEDVPLAVTLWHGEQDSLIPISHSRELARRLPTAKVVALASVGHLHKPEAIAEIASRLARTPAGAPSDEPR